VIGLPRFYISGLVRPARGRQAILMADKSNQKIVDKIRILTSSFEAAKTLE
jgi:hypothetical protein